MREMRLSNMYWESIFYTKYLEAKEKEWRAFRAQVTDWEVKQYLYKY